MATFPQIALAKPCIDDEDRRSILEPLESGWLAQGPKVVEFERLFAQQCNVKHAIAVCNGTTALHLILLALGIGEGDEVIVPSFTWVSTATAVLHCGATPVIVDVEIDSFNIDPKAIEQKISPKTKAIMPVHLFGLCADVDRIKEAVGNIPIVEDAACAVGSSYKSRPAGSLGQAAAFSFHPRKVMTTGEGGMVVTNDDALAKKVRLLKNHGLVDTSRELMDIYDVGFNFRMTDIQAALGVTQLKKLDTFLADRKSGAKRYLDGLSTVPWLRLPKHPSDYEHSWQSFVCFLDPETSPLSRKDFIAHLSKNGIESGPGTYAVHELALFRDSVERDSCRISALCAAQTVALPIHSCMDSSDYDRVIEVIRQI